MRPKFGFCERFGRSSMDDAKFASLSSHIGQAELNADPSPIETRPKLVITCPSGSRTNQAPRATFIRLTQIFRLPR